MRAGLLRTVLVLLAAAVVVAGVVVFYRRAAREQGRHAAYHRRLGKDSFETMGTVVNLRFWEGDPGNEAAMAAVRTAFDEVEACCNTYDPDSELSRLNRTAHREAFACSPLLWDLLQEARAAFEYTHGAFDISAGPLVALWGLYRKERATLPDEQELQTAMQAVGLEHVAFDDDNRTVRFTAPDMYLDLGGIAKGYALELAADRLAARGVDCGVIDLGGNVYCLPQPPPGRETYRIGIRNPRSPYPAVKTIGKVSFTDRAVATSGNYERFVEIDGQRYAHIIDTRTGRPAQGVVAVTVIARRPTVSDALSTGIFLNRGEYLDELAERFPSLRVLIIAEDDNGDLSMTTFSADAAFWEDVRDVSDW